MITTIQKKWFYFFRKVLEYWKIELPQDDIFFLYIRV